MDTMKVNAICSWPVPKNVKELCSFLGFVNFYCQFILNLAELMLPLTPLTGKRLWEWLDGQQSSFDSIISAVSSDCVLAMPDNSLPYHVEMDASDFAIGAVLSQDFDGVRRPIAFISKSFTDTEWNYSTYDKELFAIVFAFEQWCQYLLDVISTTDVLSDYWNLAFYRRPQDLNCCQARWVATLQEYNMLICHVPGCLNAHADALSHHADHIPDGADNAGLVSLRDSLFFDHSLPLPGDTVGRGVGLNVRSLSIDFLPLAPELHIEITKEMIPNQINVEVTLSLQ